MVKKIGICGGTFDPPHFGHLHLALTLKERHGLDEIWFVPAALSPHKELGSCVSFDDRLQMLELFLEEFSFCRVLDIELQRGTPSYTFDTLEQLSRKSQDQLFLLLGEDCLERFHQWYKILEIVKLVPLLVGSRSSKGIELMDEGVIKESVKKGFTKMPLLDISSSWIRGRLKKTLYCKHLMDRKVLDYIYQNGLYM
jgi:nicotinate-nucleotide adenylyltransferase